MMSRISRNNQSFRAFHRRLHEWYDKHGRKNLPWRQTDDPYAIYISEIMLQQTQVATVLERYYLPFLKRFPTLGKLAAAKQNDVLTAWQGLGYYNRAINSHTAAKNCAGALPESVEKLMELPGIGRNTAHAVAAFAYRQKVAVMEANVKRVLARIFALETPVDPELWDKAAQLLDAKNPFDYNQAMMDIGAMVCTRRKPRCSECPANEICEGKAAPEAYPAAKKKKITPVRRKHIIVLQNKAGKYFAVPRQTKFLNGLYCFVEMDASPPPIGGRLGGGRNRESLPKFAPTLTLPLKGREPLKLGHIRQQYSHFTLEADVWLENVAEQGKKNWYSLAQLKKLPMSMAEKKVLELL